jgi:hypothetical protein
MKVGERLQPKNGTGLLLLQSVVLFNKGLLLFECTTLRDCVTS